MLSRCAITPRTPQHPGHRSPGLRRVEVPGKLVRCVIGCEEGVRCQGVLWPGGGVRVLSWRPVPVDGGRGAKSPL